MKPVVFSGNTFIVSSGTVISFQGKPIEIVIEPVENVPYSIIVSFHKDDEKKESYVKVQNIDGKVGIEFLLFNFTNSLGTATIEPIAFATVNANGTSKQLYINLAVSIIGKASPILQYTVYQEK